MTRLARFAWQESSRSSWSAWWCYGRDIEVLVLLKHSFQEQQEAYGEG